MSSGNDHNRREALKKLAQLSAYSAPTVTLLLSSSLSHAQGSGVPVSQCVQGGMIVSNRSFNHNMYMNQSADAGGNQMGTNLPNTVADCGISGNMA